MNMRHVGAAVLLLVLAGATRADEASTVAALEKLGAGIERDDTKPGKPVIGVNLRRTQVTDAGLKELKELKHLSGLYLSGTHLTAEGLKELKAALPKCQITP